MRSTTDLDLGCAEALLVVVSDPSTGYDTTGMLDRLLPAAVLMDLAAHGVITMGEGCVTRRGQSGDGLREYERAAVGLGDRLEGRLPEVLWAVTNGLRPLADVVAARLVAQRRITQVKNTLLRMDFGFRFPVVDRDFRDTGWARVREALQTGDLRPPFGCVALLLVAGGVHHKLFAGVDAAAMQAVAAGETPISGAGLQDATTVTILQQAATAIQQLLRG